LDDCFCASQIAWANPRGDGEIISAEIKHPTRSYRDIIVLEAVETKRATNSPSRW
jgi:hypothetical protein